MFTGFQQIKLNGYFIDYIIKDGRKVGLETMIILSYIYLNKYRNYNNCSITIFFYGKREFIVFHNKFH